MFRWWNTTIIQPNLPLRRRRLTLQTLSHIDRIHRQYIHPHHQFLSTLPQAFRTPFPSSIQ